jgi:hypothetical protein
MRIVLYQTPPQDISKMWIENVCYCQLYLLLRFAIHRGGKKRSEHMQNDFPESTAWNKSFSDF